MSDKHWLLVDVPGVAYRAYHSVGFLSHEGKNTGVAYGFFRELVALVDRLDPDRVGFCFDGGRCVRQEVFPGYKVKRQMGALSPDARREKAEVRREIDLLRTDYLPAVGFADIWRQEGLEADDLLAMAALQLRGANFVTVATDDKDLYQALHRSVVVYHPRSKAKVTEWLFRKLYQVNPSTWANVKALCGCDTDNVPGIPGVGEKTALKHFLGELKPTGVPARKIKTAIADLKSVYYRNLRLVELPHRSTRPVKESAGDLVTRERWEGLCRRLGMKSLIPHVPVGGDAAKRLLRK